MSDPKHCAREEKILSKGTEKLYKNAAPAINMI